MLIIMANVTLKSSPPPRHCRWWVSCQYVICGPSGEYMNHHDAAPTVAAPTYPPIAMYLHTSHGN